MAMGSFSIPIGEMNAFDLPKVCLITGSDQDVVFKTVKFSWYPRWIAVLVLSPIIFLIVALIITKRAKGELPFTEQGYRQWRQGQMFFALAVLWAIAGFIGGAIAMGAEQTALGAIGFLSALVVPIVVAVKFVTNKRILCREITKTHITLTCPSEAAALAIQKHMHAAPAPGAEARTALA